MSTHQHVHPLTPFPQTSEASTSAFPFPTILPSRSSTWPSSSASTSTSTMSSTSNSSFRYPQPHARSHPSASFNLTLQGIKDSPIPPSLLERRRSSISSNFSSTSAGTVDSVASEASSTWGNWRMDSPVPALSRCGSMRSETSTRKVELKTPETAVFMDFEEVAVEGRHTRAGSFEMDVGLEDKAKSITSTRPRLFNNAPRVALPISSSPIKSMTTTERPKLERKGTPLVLPMMRPSGLFDANKMTPLSTISTTASTTKAKTTPITRPKLTRKLTPHPEFDLAPSTSRKAVTLSSSIVEEGSEDETDEETEEEIISIPNLPVRGRPLERKTWRTPMTGWNEGGNAGMRRFSSVIEEGKVWLAI